MEDFVTKRSNSQIHSPWLGGKSWLRHRFFEWACQAADGQAGTTSLCQSQLLPPVRNYEFGFKFLLCAWCKFLKFFLFRAAANAYLTPCTLELGGKSPAYLDEVSTVHTKRVDQLTWGRDQIIMIWPGVCISRWKLHVEWVATGYNKLYCICTCLLIAEVVTSDRIQIT